MLNALVIDDNRSTADAMVEMLLVFGIRASAAYGPRPGMEILEKESPDLITLDLNMPGVSGFEILSFIHRESRIDKAVVFICSSDDQPQTKQRAMKSGAMEFLLKPVTLDTLEKALRDA